MSSEDRLVLLQALRDIAEAHKIFVDCQSKRYYVGADGSLHGMQWLVKATVRLKELAGIELTQFEREFL